MKFVFEENEALSTTLSEVRISAAAMVEGLVPEQQRLILPVSTEFSTLPQQDHLYILREGALSVSFEGRELFVFEAGDLVFCPHTAMTLSLLSDFATAFEVFAINDILKSPPRSTQLVRAIALYQTALAGLVAMLNKGERRTQPAIRSVAKGEVIVREGEVSDQVFTLIEGHAHVSTQGEVVGEVHADELVGVIGALCGIPRIATVTTSVDSLVMSLGKDDFIELLSLRPQTVIKLIENFARIISSSNQQLRDIKAQTKLCQGYV